MTDQIEKKLKLVVLNCPYDRWDNPTVRKLFCEAIDLKIAGYRREYPYGVLPVDASDFVGTHHLICEEERSGELRILMAYKSVTLERCRTHRIQFPALSLARASGAHEKSVRGLIDRCDANGLPLTYYGAWTMRPELRKEKIAEKLKWAMTAFAVRFALDRPVSELVTMAVVRFKVEQLFESWGFTPLLLDGAALGPIELDIVFGEPVVLYRMRSDGFSSSALEIGSQLDRLWKSRLELDDGEAIRKKAA